MSVRIDIFYQTRAADASDHLEMRPEDYFDPLEPGQTFAEDGFPRHNFTWKYLSVPRQDLVWSIERRRGTARDTTFSTQYFDGGNVWINHRSDPTGYEELIHSADFGARGNLTIRTFKQPGGRWSTSMFSFHDAADKELFGLPAGGCEMAKRLSRELAEIASS